MVFCGECRLCPFFTTKNDIHVEEHEDQQDQEEEEDKQLNLLELLFLPYKRKNLFDEVSAKTKTKSIKKKNNSKGNDENEEDVLSRTTHSTFDTRVSV